MESRFEKTGSAVVAWWQRRSRGVFLPAHAPNDSGRRRQPEEWPPSLPFRKRPKPYSRAIAWRPSDGRRESVHDRSQPHELFVAQSVLRDVRAHLINSQNNEPYGFLLGHVVYCPWTRAPYVVIDAVRRETHDAPHSGEMDSFRRSWASASREARRRRGQIIGWYHQHGVLGLRLSQSDLQLQEEFFPEAWHCALLIVRDRRGVVGGFIQRSGRASLYRKGISGFYELIDLDAKLINGKKPSVVDWTNYTAEERVQVVPAKWPAPRRGPRLMPDVPESLEVRDDEGEEPVPAPEPEEKTEIRPVPGSGLTTRRWKQRATPTPNKSASKTRPRAVAQPTRKKERTSKAGAKANAETAKVESADDVDTAAETADIGDEFHEALGPMEPEPDEAPAESGPVRPALDADDDQVAEFLEAIWGPSPFEQETSEAPVMELPLYRELMLTDAPEMSPTLEGAEVSTPAAGPTEGLGAEPPEADSTAGSFDWLLGLVEETIGGSFPATERADTPSDEAVAAAGEAAEAAEQDGPPPGEPVGAARAPGAGRATVSAASAAGGTVRVTSDARSTFVGISDDPDEDPEAEIPVVMPTGDGLGSFLWLRRHRNRALIAAAIAVAAVSAWLVLGRERHQSAFQTPAAGDPAAVAPPAARSPAQGPEFIRLSGEFTAALAAYGEREADFQLGRIDCIGLTTGYDILTAAFRELSEHVALAPSGSVDFGPFADDMRAARTRFEGSGCEVPQGTA